MLEIIVITVILFIVLAIQIVKAGAEEDFQQAVRKCNKCKHFTGKDTKCRLIYCNGYAVTPDEVRECKHFEEKGDKND